MYVKIHIDLQLLKITFQGTVNFMAVELTLTP